MTTITAENARISDPAPYAPRPWTSRELTELRRVAPLGAHTAAVILGRTRRSVETAARRHGISLRQAGSRVGRLLGQPNGTSYATARQQAEEAQLVAQLRADVRDGRITIADLERALGAIDAGAPLCPSCGHNPADKPDVGLCTACHLRRLTAAHEAALSARTAQQGLWRARQELSRERRRTGDQP